VPLIRVRPSNARGFVRRHPRSRRAFQYSNGETLFPIPVRISAEDLLRVPSWRAEVVRLRAHDVNFVEVPVSWPEALSVSEQEQALLAVDRLLVEAERTGRLAVLLRLEAPEDVSGTGADSYREQLGRWVQRWAYSPALAAWYLAGAGDGVNGTQRAAFVNAVREVDSYNHLIAVPATGDGAAVGDLTVAPQEWQRPSNRYALLEAQSGSDSTVPLPGEDTWQSLVLGGVGLPIQPYRPGMPEGETTLRRIAQLARAAGKIPYQTTATPITGLVPADSPGSFTRYGKSVVGWVAPDDEHTFALPRLAMGRYQLLLWDPARDRFLDDSVLQFDGTPRRMKLPETLSAVYFMLRPARGGAQPKAVSTPAVSRLAPPPKPAVQRRTTWKPVPKHQVQAPKRPVRKAKPVATTRRAVRSKPFAKPKPTPVRSRGKVRAKPPVKSSKRTSRGQTRVKKSPAKKAPVKKTATLKSRKSAKRVVSKKPARTSVKARKAPATSSRATKKRSVKRRR